MQTSTGESVSLIDFVAQHNSAGDAVLLGWMRHFGCTLCKKHAADWRALLPDITRLGPISVALIGNGPPAQAVDFIAELDWPTYLFTDPQRVTYRALGLRRGVSTTFTLPGLQRVMSSLRQGNSQTLSRIPTDPFQQGGAILVDTSGNVTLYHIEAFAGDYIDTDELMTALRAAMDK